MYCVVKDKAPVSSGGVYFDIETAYSAYKSVVSLNENVSAVVDSFSESTQKLMEDLKIPNNYLVDYANAFKSTKKYLDFSGSFCTEFQECLNKMSSIDSNFMYYLNLMILSEGAIYESLLETPSGDIASLYNEYYTLCIFAAKTGNEEAKNYYSLKQLEAENRELYSKYVEFSEIQNYAYQCYGYPWGEFPAYTYKKFRKSPVVLDDGTKKIEITYTDFTLNFPPSTYRYSFEKTGSSSKLSKTNEEMFNAEDSYISDYMSWYALRIPDVQKMMLEEGDLKFKIEDLPDNSVAKTAALQWANDPINIYNFKVRFSPDFARDSIAKNSSADIYELKEKYDAAGNDYMVVSNDEDFVKIIYELACNGSTLTYSAGVNGGGPGVHFTNLFTDSNGYQYYEFFSFSQTYEWDDPKYNEWTHYQEYIKWFQFLTEDDKATIRFLYVTEGTEGVLDFFEKTAYRLDAQYVAKQKAQDSEWAVEHKFAASVYSIFMTPLEGMMAAFNSLDAVITDSPLYMTNTYSKGTVVRGAVAESLGDVGGFFYSTGMSMADSALLMGVNVMTGGTMSWMLSATLMGSRSYVSTLNNALERGLTADQAVILATSSAAIETITEKLQVDRLLSLDVSTFPGMSNVLNSFANNPAAYNFLKVVGGAIFEGAAEGTEEALSEFLNTVADMLVARDDSEVMQLLNSKLASGMSENQAILEVIKEKQHDITMAYLGGFVSGLGFGAGSSVHGVNVDNNTCSEIAQGIMDMYNDSTFNYDAKSLHLNLLKGDFTASLHSVLDISSTNFTTNFLAANTLYNSINANFDVTAEQQKEMQSILSDAVNRFSNMSLEEQTQQFNSLTVENQTALLTLLKDDGIHLFKGLELEQQKTILGKLTLAPSQQLDILLQLDADTQKNLLPEGTTSLKDFIIKNANSLTMNQLTNIDAEINSISSEIKSLFDTKIGIVSEQNNSAIDSLIKKVTNDPSKITELFDKYKNNKSIDQTKFSELVSKLKDATTKRYNLTHTGETIFGLMSKDATLTYEDAYAMLLCPELNLSVENTGYAFDDLLFSDNQTSSDGSNIVNDNVNNSNLSNDFHVSDVENNTTISFENFNITDVASVNALFEGIFDPQAKYAAQKSFIDSVCEKLKNGETISKVTYDAIFNSAMFAGDSTFSKQYLYDTLLEMGGKEFADTISSIYESAMAATRDNPLMSNLYSYCDHREAHILQVAFLSMSALNKLNLTVDAGNTAGGKYAQALDYKTMFIAGLMHDLGMGAGVFDSNGNPINPSINSFLTKDKDGNVIINSEVIANAKGVADIVRGNHTLNSALAVLQNRTLFEQMGVDPDLVALLCFSHSKSNSGVVDLTSAADWSFSIEKISNAVEQYNRKVGKHKGTPITFDINKFGNTTGGRVTTSPQKISDGSKAPYAALKVVFKEGLLEQLSTLGFALRVGDAYVNKAKVVLPAGQELSWTYNGKLYTADTLVLTQTGMYMAYDPTQAVYFQNGLNNDANTESSAHGAFIYFKKNEDGTFVPWNPVNPNAKYETDIDGSYIITNGNKECLMSHMGGSKIEINLSNGKTVKAIILDNGYYRQDFKDNDGNVIESKYYDTVFDAKGNLIGVEITPNMPGYDSISKGNPINSTTGQFLAGESNVFYDFDIDIITRMDGSLIPVIKSIYNIGDIRLFPYNTIEKGILERVGEIVTAKDINRSVDIVINLEQFNQYFDIVDGKVVAKVLSPGEINYGQIYIEQIYAMSVNNNKINFTINGYSIHSNNAINNIVSDIVNTNLNTEIKRILSGLNLDVFDGVVKKLLELCRFNPNVYNPVITSVFNNIEVEQFLNSYNKLDSHMQLDLFNSLDNVAKIKLFERLDSEQLFNIISNTPNAKWILNYTLIKSSNCKSVLKVDVDLDGNIRYNLKWPLCGGYDVDTITTLEHFILAYNDPTSIKISRIGSVYGYAIGTDQTSNCGERSIPYDSSASYEGRTADFNGIEYLKLCGILSSDDSLSVKKSNIMNLFGVSEEVAVEVLKSYNTYMKNPDIVGEGSITNTLGQESPSPTGYAGKAASWTNEAFSLKGGAGQMNTVCSFTILEQLGIINNVMENVRFD